eukprot:5311277-Prymnesium_polylepis.1
MLKSSKSFRERPNSPKSLKLSKPPAAHHPPRRDTAGSKTVKFEEAQKILGVDHGFDAYFHRMSCVSMCVF